MPLYEYQCEACGHRFEVIQKFSDAPVEKCPVCGGSVQKLQSAPAFQFRGSGWYVTDYAKKDQAPAKAGTKGPAGDKTEKPGEKSAETKSEKSEPKTETKTDTKGSS